jgi:flavin reductase (DIM6/NTAB) family NADH-FMN oxidoreductase RutF
VMPGLGQNTHTYKNIMRTREFCVNFLGPQYYEACMKTIHDNSEDADELAVGGFTPEEPVNILAPRIAESFLSLECTLESVTDLSGKGITSLVVGRVVSIAADEDYAKGLDEKYGPSGFMFNIHAPKNLMTGEGDTTAVAALSVLRTVD